MWNSSLVLRNDSPVSRRTARLTGDGQIEIQQRCIRMLAELFNAPGEADRALALNDRAPRRRRPSRGR